MEYFNVKFATYRNRYQTQINQHQSYSKCLHKSSRFYLDNKQIQKVLPAIHLPTFGFKQKNNQLGFGLIKNKNKRNKENNHFADNKKINKGRKNSILTIFNQQRGNKQNEKMIATEPFQKQPIFSSKITHFQQTSIDYNLMKTQRQKLCPKRVSLSKMSRKSYSSCGVNQSETNFDIKHAKAKLIVAQSAQLFSTISKNDFSLIKQDIELIEQIFSNLIQIAQICVYRSYFFQLKTDLGKLIFFLGLEHDQNYKKEKLGQSYLYKITKCLHYQIYYGLWFKIPLLSMQTLLQLIRIYSGQKQYEKCQYFCQVLLKISLYYHNQFYEESAFQYIGLCQYKMGDIEGARNLYENIGKMSQESRKKFRNFYHESNYMFMLRQYLFNGQPLKISQNFRLIQTIIFEKQPEKEDITRKYVNKSLGQSRCPRRMLICRLNKDINQFKISQYRRNDLRKSSNEKAIKSIKREQFSHQHSYNELTKFAYGHGYKINAFNDDEQMSNSVLANNSKIIVDNKVVNAKNFNVLRSHETIHWNEEKIKQNLQNHNGILKSFRHFRHFLKIFIQIIQKQLNRDDFN